MGRDLDRMVDAALTETGRRHRRTILFWRWGGRYLLVAAVAAVALGTLGLGAVRLWAWASGTFGLSGPTVLAVLGVLALALGGLRALTRSPQEAARRRARRL
jgi:hypothetical protein